MGDKTPPFAEAVRPGDLLGLVPEQALPPVAAPLPVLTESEVSESPLPAVLIAPAPNPAPGTSPGNAQSKVTVCFYLSALAMLAASFLLL